MEKFKQDFYLLFENSGTAFAILNPNGTIFSINNIFEVLSGYSQNEIENKRLLIDFISGKSYSDVKNCLEAFSKESSPKLNADTFECKFINRQGYQKIIVLTLNCLSESKKIIATLIDVSKIKRSQLNSMNAEHRDTIAKIGSGIAHEVRNPLQAIITSVEGLRDSIGLMEQGEELMEIICEEIMNLKKIIDKFNQFTRLEETKFEFFQIDSLINQTLNSFDKHFFSGIKKVIKLNDDLPKAYVDKKQMCNVLKHIIINAIEAMPHGGILSIQTNIVTNESHEKQIQIKIQDIGSGIYEADFERLFKPFFSTKNTNIGLGLAYCERIIFYHKGEIKIESELDKGTKVYINLPLIFPL